MNKKILVAIVGLSLLACNFLFPPKEAPPPVNTPVLIPTEAIDAPDAQPSPKPEGEKPVQNTDTPIPPLTEGFTAARLHPEDGDLKKLLVTEAQKATALDLMPVVEFDATWCPPCKAIEQGLKEKNKLMLDAYAGTYLIKLDVDEWGWGDSKLHDFDFEGIPVYFKLDSNGNPTGETIDGNAWGDNIPENIAPVMEKFFHGE